MRDEDSPGDLRAALEWLVRLNDARAPAGLQPQFEAWLSASDGHRRAWEEANLLWSEMEPVKAGYETMTRRDRMMDRRQVLGGMAGLAVIGAGGWHVSRPWFGADHMTAVGETRSIILADGTEVALASRSAIGLPEVGAGRGLRLLRGEAFLSVAPGEDSFVLSAAKGRLRTREADFNVNLGQDRVGVAVARRQVAIEVPGVTDALVFAGQTASFDARQITPPVAIDATAIGAWRQGRLVFHSTPLGEVLAELERWRGGMIAIPDRAAAAIPVTAIFETAQIDLALETIVQTLALRRMDLPGPITVIRGG